MRRRSADRDGLAKDLAGLPGLTTEGLKDRWRELFGRAPPARISRPLLLRSLAYRMQEQVFGPLKPATRRLLDQVAEAQAAGKPIAVRAPSFKPGTRILREWRGETHEVTLLDEGVSYRGEKLRSLSEVARRITGARWSGPRFFGLRGKEAGDVA